MKVKEMVEKTVRIGTIDTGNGRYASIYCKIKLNGCFSISGVVGPLPFGNALGSCGQIDMEFEHRHTKDNDSRFNHLIKPSNIRFASGWTADLWLDFLDVWKRWHLNDMRSGCKHQRKLEWEKDGYDKHPSEPCPVCGYKYGTAWHSEKIPQSVIDFIEKLPLADRKPAWC